MFQLTRFSHYTVFFRNQNARYAGTRCILRISRDGKCCENVIAQKLRMRTEKKYRLNIRDAVKFWTTMYYCKPDAWENSSYHSRESRTILADLMNFWHYNCTELLVDKWIMYPSLYLTKLRYEISLHFFDEINLLISLWNWNLWIKS